MTPIHRDILHLLRDLRRRGTADASLHALARRSGWSPSHLHRAFRRMLRETPKGYTQRVRLEQAAARLAATRDSVLSIALGTAFASHEVFARAFRRRFGCSPARYRALALRGATAVERERHAELVAATSPCINLHHLGLDSHERNEPMPTLSIAREDLAPQPTLFARRRGSRAELQKHIAEALGAAFGLAMQSGCAIGGRPFTRYASIGAGLITIEAGCPLASPAPGLGDVEAGFLQGGPTAVALHAGGYDELPATYAALERWIEEHGYRVAGPPWESYLTDPADFPSPADWRTQVYWPIAR